MPISLKCSCGKSYRVKDELAGRKVRCTGCNNIQTVPVPRPKPADDEFLEVELEEIPKARAPQGVREASRAPLPFSEPPVQRPRPRRYEDDDDDDDYERRPKKRKSRSPKRERSGGGGIVVSGGIIGGGLMIAGGLIWLVLGLMAGWIFFYPIILVIAGIIAVIKGLMGAE